MTFSTIQAHADNFSLSRLQVLLLLKRRNPREPIHVHVERDELEAKLWLIPEVRVAYNDGYDARTLRMLLGVVEVNKDRIVRAWNEYFGS